MEKKGPDIKNKQQHLSPNDLLLPVMSRLLNQTPGAWGDLLDGRKWASDWGITLNTGYYEEITSKEQDREEELHRAAMAI